MQETWVWSLGCEDPLEKEMATHSSIAWRIPWTERGAWQTSAHGVTRVEHDLATKPPPQSWNTGHRSYLMFRERPNKWLRTPLGPRRQAASLDCKPLPFKPRAAERKSPVFFGSWVTSNSLRPLGLQPTRLLCLWDFPGKNTGVGCHFLLQGGLSDPGIKPASLALADRFFTTEPPGKL